MFFPYASPKMFGGVDQLESDLGTKIILGDGGLFAREPQNITNSDLAHEYASCESARSVINTPMGVFFISQAQGKIFQYTGKLEAISDRGMKWWFNKYLPSILLRQLPDLEGTELEDNPVVGIGCQAVYDINDGVVYFTKKDYSIKDEFINNVSFNTFTCQFTFSNDITSFPIKLEEGIYFDNASWTISYDPKVKGWISFHDWHPEFVLPSINHFLTTKTFITDKAKCPPTYYLNNNTGLCEKLINESAPGFVDIDEVSSSINYNVDPIECNCQPGYTLVYPDVTSNPVVYDQQTGDCITNVLTSLGGPGNGTPIIPPSGNIECPIDIVFSIQADDSIIDKFFCPPGPNIFSPKCYRKKDSIKEFIDQFITSPDIAAGLDLGEIQIGFQQVAKVDPHCNGGSINYWVARYDTFDFGGNTWMTSTDIPGINPGSMGNALVNWLDNDFLATPPPCWTSFSIAQQNLSSNQVLNGAGPLHQYAIGVYTDPQAAGGWLGPIVGGAIDYTFGLANWADDGAIYTNKIAEIVDKIKEICEPPPPPVYCDCYDYTITILDSAPLDQYDILYQVCITGSYETRVILKGETITILCVRENSVSFAQNIDASSFSRTQGALCDTQYDCDSGPTSGPSYTAYAARCRKIDCGCPPSSLPNATLFQTGNCSGLDIYATTGVGAIPPGLITCEYEALLQVAPSFESGSIWRHNYRCDLYANFYGVDYPWEVELIENTGQAVNTIRSFEYQLETYVYKGDLHNGCGDDRWHDLDFNFDKAIIYNSEQVSGLLTLVPHPKEDPLNMIIYPIIGAQDIQILYSKEEQKYRFNQFWDITRDRAEFTNPTTTPPFFPTYQYQPGVTPLDSPGQNIFITELNGYIKDLNFNNLLYQKSSSQRKKFRHYFNKVILRRTLSGNRKMLLKLNNTKLNLSVR